MMDKIRIFKPGEPLNTIFSARHFGLCLVADVKRAITEFPERNQVHNAGEYSDAIDEWFEKWFSDFTPKSDMKWNVKNVSVI